MSMHETLMKHDRVLRMLCSELGVEFEAKPAPKKKAVVRTVPAFDEGTRPPLANNRWNAESDESIIQMYNKNIKPKDIAKAMGRTPPAIHTRLWHLRKQERIT